MTSLFDAMVSQNEILTLLLAGGVWALILLKYKAFEKIPHFRLLAVAFLFLTISWLATNAEWFCWHNGFNLVEHAGYCASSIAVAFWCRMALRTRTEAQG